MNTNTTQRKRDISKTTLTQNNKIFKKQMTTKNSISSGASGVGALHAPGVTTQKRIPNPFARDFVPDNLWKAYASPYVKYGTMGKKQQLIAKHQNAPIRTLSEVVIVNDSLNIIKRRERKFNDRTKKTDWGVKSQRSHDFKAEKAKKEGRKIEKASFNLESSKPNKLTWSLLQ